MPWKDLEFSCGSSWFCLFACLSAQRSGTSFIGSSLRRASARETHDTGARSIQTPCPWYCAMDVKFGGAVLLLLAEFWRPEQIIFLPSQLPSFRHDLLLFFPKCLSAIKNKGPESEEHDWSNRSPQKLHKHQGRDTQKESYKEGGGQKLLLK